MDDGIHEVNIGFAGDIPPLELPLHIDTEVENSGVQLLKKHTVESVQVLVACKCIFNSGITLLAVRGEFSLGERRIRPCLFCHLAELGSTLIDLCYAPCGLCYDTTCLFS